MTISWQWMVIVIVLVVACVVAAVLGEDVIAGTLGGFAGGLLTKGGAIGRKSSAAAAALLALVLAGCGSSAAYGAVAGVCEAHEAALEAACDSTGPSAPGRNDGQCTGEMSTEEYREALQCTTDICDAIQARIDAGSDDE